MTLDGKVALVTGGARRLGRAIAEDLARDGAWLAIHYRASKSAARELCDLVEQRGSRRPEMFQADLADAEAAARLPAQIATRMRQLDIVVNSATNLLRLPLGQVTTADWDRVLNLNVRSYFFVAQSAAPWLRKTKGTIINVSDAAAFRAWPEYIPHSVSKAGVEMLTKGLALALAPEVTVNAVAPGPVLVPERWSEERRQTRASSLPLARLGEPDDVVRAVRFLLESGYSTGSTIIVDGGQVLGPDQDV